MRAPFTFATWNILATAYIRTEYYPATPPRFLYPEWRVPALVRRAEELQADILCLQEVERAVFDALQRRLAASGYAGSFQKKAGKKPDGCALFFRTARFRLVEERQLIYEDGGSGRNSGHIAQMLTLDVGGLELEVVNTHLKWDPAGTPRDRQWGYRQISEAVAALSQRSAERVSIICGDFNVQWDSPVVALLRSVGFRATHQPGADIYSCNSSGEPKLIDFIFFRGPVDAEAFPLDVIHGDTPLPSEDHPSDHLPLVARFVPGRLE